MSDPTYLETLASFVPALILKRVAHNPLPLDAPLAENFQAVMLFADISGFTALSERLAAGGASGAEELSDVLNRYFTQFIDLIHEYGGGVVKFAGDALLAIWIETPDISAAHLAALCSLKIQSQLSAGEAGDDVHLAVRIGLGVGQVLVAHIGGVFRRWEFVLSGEAVRQASLAESRARPGEVVVSDQIVARLGPLAALNDENVLLDLDWSAKLPGYRRPEVSPEMEAALHNYIPAAILARLAAQQSGWIAELRRVTVLFINIPGFGQENTTLAQAQTVMHALQEGLYRYEGSVNKISLDEKGVTLVAALGLPPYSHVDDAVRGALAALDVYQRLADLGVFCSIGLTSGRVFCGSIGHPLRREYTMIGQTVNLAARLMVAAAGLPEGALKILCDEATRDAAQESIAFRTLPPVMVKGRAEPVAVYLPLERKQAALRSQVEIVGRQDERRLLRQRLDMLKLGQGSLVFIEGEAGIGKSCLLDHLLARAYGDHLQVLVGAGDAIEKSASYHAWRPVFRQVFGLESPLAGMEAGRQASAELLPAQKQAVLDKFRTLLPDQERFAPLLNSVLPLDLPDTAFTAQVSGEVRAENTRRILLALLGKAAASAPLLLAIEDAHWLDSASWILLRMAHQSLKGAMIVVVTRPMSALSMSGLSGASDALPPDFTRLREAPEALHIVLQPLPTQDAVEMVCRRMGVSSLPEAVSSLIREKAEGHPFFSEELAYALRDAGLIEIRAGECLLRASSEEIRSLLPDTIEGAIISRIDRLLPQQQLTLKVASVIGRVFAVRILRDIYPIVDDQADLVDHLSRLEQLDLTPLDTPEPDMSYIFKHIITQEVAYNLMLFAQRKQLHRTVAEWYESAHSEDLTPFYPLLAHHYTQAEEGEKAVEYLSKAGEQALRQFANQEAIHFLSGAIELLQNMPAPARSSAAQQRARWERLLGQAYVGLGNLPKGKEHLYRALHLLGRPMPASSARLALSLVGQLLRQLVHLSFPRWMVVSAGGRQAPLSEVNALLMETYHVYDCFFEIFYFGGDRAGIIYCALRMLNLAERAIPSAERSRALIGMCLIASVAGNQKLAARYRREALEIAGNFGGPAAQAWVRLIGNLSQLGAEGSSQALRDELREVETSFERLGDRRRQGEARTVRALSHYYNADYQVSLDLTQELYTLTLQTNDQQQRIWAIQGQGRNLVVLGRSAEAVALLEQARPLLDRNIDAASDLIVTGLLARAYWQQGDSAPARQAMEKAAWIIFTASPTAFSSQVGYDGVVRTALDIWEQQFQAGAQPSHDLRQLAGKALKASRRFARSFPINLPSAWRSQGVYEWLNGKPGAAHKAWQNALQHARRLNYTHEEALALYEIGRHSQGAQRRQALAEAIAILERIGAANDLQMAQQAQEI